MVINGKYIILAPLCVFVFLFFGRKTIVNFMTPQQPPTFDLPEPHRLMSGDKQPRVVLWDIIHRTTDVLTQRPMDTVGVGATSVIRLFRGEVATPLSSYEWVSRAAAGQRSQSQDLLDQRPHPRLRHVSSRLYCMWPLLCCISVFTISSHFYEVCMISCERKKRRKKCGKVKCAIFRDINEEKVTSSGYILDCSNFLISPS